MDNRRQFFKLLSLFSFFPMIGTNGSLKQLVKEQKFIESCLPFLKIGKVNIKSPTEFSTSPFGIGCETLDRELWDPKEIYPWMDNLPVKWARLQTGWARVEKTKGEYDWGWLDYSINGLIKRGFKPFLNVGYGNPNYNDGDDAIGYQPMVDQNTFQGWKIFLEKLINRYKDRIQHYEIWNEPNLNSFWKPGNINPEQYAQLVKESSRIIRENYSDAIIIGGVLSRIPVSYTKKLFEYGLAEAIDIFSFHPYGVVPENYVTEIKALKRLINTYSQDIKIWQGEMGYPSDPNSSGYAGISPWTERIQAKIMLRRMISDCAAEVDMTLWFLIVDIHDYPKGSGKINYKGILRVKPEVQPKLAFSVLQNLGSVIYGEVSVRNAVVRYGESNKNSVEEWYRLLGRGIAPNLVENVFTAFLNTGGGKVFAFWKAIKASDEFEDENIDLFLWDWEGTGFEDPVMVDLLTGDIFEIIENIRRFSDAHAFAEMPLRDYPLLIVERKSVL